jgi:predicted restriction endonuclease
VRTIVLDRDRRRCAVPGCSGRFWLHLHHLQPFSLDGSHDPTNLLTLCACHHRLIHEGYLRVEVDDDGAVHAERPDGSVRVGPAEPRRRPTHVGHGKRGAEASTVGAHRPTCAHARSGR